MEEDIKGCFDHHVLVNILRRRIQDEHFIGLIWKFLKAGYMEDWTYHNTYSGTPQGPIISPILANIYLNELDELMARYAQTFRQGDKRLVYVRYADDFLIGVIGSKEDAKQVKAKVGQFIQERLHLELSQEKTLITHGTDFARFFSFQITASSRTQKGAHWTYSPP